MRDRAELGRVAYSMFWRSPDRAPSWEDIGPSYRDDFTREAEAVPAVPTRSRLLLTLAWCWLWLRAWWLCQGGDHPVARLVVARKWDTLDHLCDEVWS